MRICASSWLAEGAQSGHTRGWGKIWTNSLLYEPGKKVSRLEVWLYIINVLAAGKDDEKDRAQARGVTRQRARYSALYAMTLMISAAAGSAVGGLIVQHIGYIAIFVVSGVGRILGNVLLWRLVKAPPEHLEAAVG